MKSVLIISSVTFLLIFGGVAALVLVLGDRMPAAAAAAEGDQIGGERLLRDAALERDRLQRQKEQLASLEGALAAREAVMSQIHNQLLATIGELEKRQDSFITEQDDAAARLAKMYAAMKPQKAAMILSSLEMEITVAILARMKERAAAEVLTYMDAGLAAQISTRLSLQGGA